MGIIESKMLNTLGIGKEGIGLVKKIVDLKNLDENIFSINFLKSEGELEKFSVQVKLKKGFDNLKRFRTYTKKMELKGDLTLEANSSEKGPYLIFNDGVVIEFYD